MYLQNTSLCNTLCVTQVDTETPSALGVGSMPKVGNQKPKRKVKLIPLQSSAWAQHPAAQTSVLLLHLFVLSAHSVFCTDLQQKTSRADLT